MAAFAGAPAAGAPATPATAANPAAAVAKLADGACLGIWQNPSGSVRFRATRCGEQVCGTIVFANDKARADARRGGTDPLIGTQLFEEFTARGPPGVAWPRVCSRHKPPCHGHGDARRPEHDPGRRLRSARCLS